MGYHISQHNLHTLHTLRTLHSYESDYWNAQMGENSFSFSVSSVNVKKPTLKKKWKKFLLWIVF